VSEASLGAEWIQDASVPEDMMIAKIANALIVHSSVKIDDSMKVAIGQTSTPMA